jgi:hypothetical protein
MVLWWGRSAYTQFYNDAFISFLGTEKHPAFLGRSGRVCWSEIWPFNQTALQWFHAEIEGHKTGRVDYADGAPLATSADRHLFLGGGLIRCYSIRDTVQTQHKDIPG